jgi:hypothetical protein
MKKKYLIIVIFLIFIVSAAVRYWPILHKGFPYGFSANSLILARNLNSTGEYKIESEKNVILSSEIIKEKGIESELGNKLMPVLYGTIFNILGFNQGVPPYVSLILYSIVSVLLFLLVLKLFNIQVALLFSFIEIFSPLVLQQASTPGFYEWGVLFLTVALLFYLWKEKSNLLVLFSAGLFLALASLARNSFLVIACVFFVYELWKNKSLKRIIIFVLPVLVLWIIYLGPSFIKNGAINNNYLSPTETTSFFLHIFPDPYTWHFERDAYAESIKGISNYDYSEFLSRYGYSISLKNRILMYWASIKSYPVGLFEQTTIGGPFLVFFLVLGGFYLFKQKKNLMQLFIFWTVILYLFLIITKSNNWGFFIALQLPLFLLVALGIYCFSQFMLRQNFKNIFKYSLVFGFIFVLFLHLIQSDKWMLHEKYLYSGMEQTLGLIKSIQEGKQEIDKKTDVIAVGTYVQAESIINYYTDISCVYFDRNTIKKLLDENKLQWAFDQFNVNKVIGYDKELNEKIIKVTNAEIISN